MSCPKPPNRQKRLKAVKKALDKTAKEIAKTRDGWACLMCRKKEGLNSHHWLVRKGHSLRLAYDPRNLATLCAYPCHLGRVHKDGDGLFIMAMHSKMQEIIGADAIAEMTQIAEHTGPVSLEDLEAMLESLRTNGRLS
jgi:hypothetical protein